MYRRKMVRGPPRPAQTPLPPPDPGDMKALLKWLQRDDEPTNSPQTHITIKTGVILNKILQCFGRETFLLKGRENNRISFPFSSSNSAVVLQSSVERVFIFGGRQC